MYHVPFHSTLQYGITRRRGTRHGRTQLLSFLVFFFQDQKMPTFGDTAESAIELTPCVENRDPHMHLSQICRRFPKRRVHPFMSKYHHQLHDFSFLYRQHFTAPIVQVLTSTVQATQNSQQLFRSTRISWLKFPHQGFH